MQYIVIDNTDEPIVAQKDGKAAIFNTLEDAYRFSLNIQNSIVYPLTDIINIIDKLYDILDDTEYRDTDIHFELKQIIDDE